MNNGNLNFNLNQKRQIPSNVIGYVSLKELTLNFAITNKNTNTYNNTLVLVDDAANPQKFTIPPIIIL